MEINNNAGKRKKKIILLSCLVLIFIPSLGEKGAA